LWKSDEVGTNDSAKKHLLQVFDGESRFDTPKPEELIARIVEIASNAGDLVLDSFLGSGTTAAVAHKLGRRWIGIELGEHATTCCLPRLKMVVEGNEPGGITTHARWQGGGGFRFFKLAPSLLEKDKWGNWIVSKQYKPEMLAEAMCKLEGFRCAPDREVFWNHGYSTERDFIYVTTQNLSREQLQFISEQVGEERTLLICCAAFRGKPDFQNLTVKKIPQAVLARCEWGRDDYSLNVAEQAPVIAVEEAKAEASTNGANKGDSKTKTGGRRKKPAPMPRRLTGVAPVGGVIDRPFVTTSHEGSRIGARRTARPRPWAARIVVCTCSRVSEARGVGGRRGLIDVELTKV
jgi:adenine-specific DNA-methyltransferase